MIMSNSTLPPLPSYSLTPLAPLVPGIPDKYLTLVLPIVAYWGVSLFFHCIDEWDLFPQYRLHTPAEVLKRNHVTRWEVLRDVVLQQIIQTIFGVFLGYLEEDAMIGREHYDISVWAQRIRMAQRSIPSLLAIVGMNAQGIAKNVAVAHPMLAASIAGGHYNLFQETSMGVAPAFAPWEMLAAKAVYWYGVPAVQFAFAILVVDTWQYFLHRAMHMNKWLYSKCFQEIAR
jgi:sphinganine C4-monooxygenase